MIKYVFIAKNRTLRYTKHMLETRLGNNNENITHREHRSHNYDENVDFTRSMLDNSLGGD